MGRQRQAGRISVVSEDVSCMCVLKKGGCGGCSLGFLSAVVTGLFGILQLSNESQKVMPGLVSAAWQVDVICGPLWRTAATLACTVTRVLKC